MCSGTCVLVCFAFVCVCVGVGGGGGGRRRRTHLLQVAHLRDQERTIPDVVCVGHVLGQYEEDARIDELAALRRRRHRHLDDSHTPSAPTTNDEDDRPKPPIQSPMFVRSCVRKTECALQF